MSTKRVPIGLKPGVQKNVEEWVSQPQSTASVHLREEGAPPASMKRLTIDVPEELHRRLKVKAASDGTKMADLVRRWIEEGCA